MLVFCLPELEPTSDALSHSNKDEPWAVTTKLTNQTNKRKPISYIAPDPTKTKSGYKDYGFNVSRPPVLTLLSWIEMYTYKKRDLLRKISPEVDPRILLDTNKGLGAVVKFLDSLPQQLLCWLDWLKQLVKIVLCANLWYRSTGCYA